MKVSAPTPDDLEARGMLPPWPQDAIQPHAKNSPAANTDLELDLLAALRTIVSNASSVQMDPQWAVQVARTAIAKATGEQK